jgi:hypothetical protein
MSERAGASAQRDNSASNPLTDMAPADHLVVEWMSPGGGIMGETTDIRLNGHPLTVGLAEVGGGRLRLWMDPGDAPRIDGTVRLTRGQIDGWYVVESAVRLPDPPVAMVVLSPIDPPGHRRVIDMGAGPVIGRAVGS